MKRKLSDAVTPLRVAVTSEAISIIDREGYFILIIDKEEIAKLISIIIQGETK